MKKKFIILPVVTILMVCGFSACSQDDDLFEYDLGNDGVATLAKRSMPRNGEVITPPTHSDSEISILLTSVLPDSLGNHDSFSAFINFSLKWTRDGPTVKLITAKPSKEEYHVKDFGIRKGDVDNHYFYTCNGYRTDTTGYDILYYGEVEAILSPSN